jgi:two-component system, NarL family, nitrate/nitrite response regulator NarL
VADTDRDPDVVDLAELVRRGLVAVLLTPELLEATLPRLAGGQLLVPADLTRLPLDRAAGPPQREGWLVGPTQREGRPVGPPRRDRRSPALTAREIEALRLLAEGLSNKQIARRLGVSEHGAKRLVASIMVKLDSPNRTLAVAIAIRDGLITMEAA